MGATAKGTALVLVLVGIGFLGACEDEVTDQVTEDRVRSAFSAKMQERGRRITFTDPRTGMQVTATLQDIRERIEETEGGRYLVRADFEAEDGTIYDLDFYLAPAGEEFAIRDTVVHEVDGETVISEEERTRLDTLSRGP